MSRVLSYLIEEEWYGRTVIEYLRYLGFSEKNMPLFKRHMEAVLVNEKPVLLKSILNQGDKISITIPEEKESDIKMSSGLKFNVVYEDEDILVVDKPHDMPIQPSKDNYENTLGNAVAYYYRDRKEPFVYRCINRLDRDTTGLTIIARHILSASVLYDEMTGRKIHREYVAIVEGHVKEDEGTISAPLARTNGEGIERCVDFAKGEEAVTHFKVLDRSTKGPELSFVSLHLETGRTHQIRVHMKYIGHPLAGDKIYNPANVMMGRQALHARRLEFIHPITKEVLVFEANIPQDMSSLLATMH